MDIAEATWQAETLIQVHLGSEWKLAWMRERRVFGRCHYDIKTIFLSRVLVPLNEEAQVIDTILHEIAHALTPGDGHGNLWRAAARSLGAVPKTKGKGAAPDKRWRAECVCGRVYKRDRLPDRKRPNRYCSNPECPNSRDRGHVPLVYLRADAA